MTLTLEFPPELESQLEHAARSSGTDAGAFVMEATRRALEPLRAAGGVADASTSERAPALSPMEAAIEKIKANPIRSCGPIDAAADLEEVRAGRMDELGV